MLNATLPLLNWIILAYHNCMPIATITITSCVFDFKSEFYTRLTYESHPSFCPFVCSKLFPANFANLPSTDKRCECISGVYKLLFPTSNSFILSLYDTESHSSTNQTKATTFGSNPIRIKRAIKFRFRQAL